MAGDFDGDGCGTVALYPPATGRLYVIDRLGEGDRGLGAAERELDFAVPGGRPLAADWSVLTFGDPGDVLLGGDWDGDGCAEFAAYRPATGVVHLEGLGPATPGVGGGRAVVPLVGRFER